MDIVIAGGSGFIGSHLKKALLERGDKVTLLSRSAGSGNVVWDGHSAGDWEGVLDGADAVVNLCGAGVADRPWTKARRKVLIESRLDSTRALVDAFARRKAPKVLVNASAVGYYGEGSAAELDEGAARGKGFLANLCADWETEAAKAESAETRVVRLRIGVVLGPDGGALKKMLLPFKLALGGRPSATARNGCPGST